MKITKKVLQSSYMMGDETAIMMLENDKKRMHPLVVLLGLLKPGS